MESSRAFSPGHVTGFFSIRPHSDPYRHGSLGAGFSLEQGVTTVVSPAVSDSIRMNGKPLEDAPVSRAVLRRFRETTGAADSWAIEHSTALPIGCGFGTSGAGALSLALALNAGAGSPLSHEEAGALAHLAEIECGTGLGTVLGESHGGFKVSLVPGAPGTGQVRQLPSPEGLTAVFVVLGPLATPAMLANPAIRDAVNREGESFRLALLEQPSWSKFLELSFAFGRKTGLVTEGLSALQDALTAKGFTAPMLMFGNGLFTLVEQARSDAALTAFQALAVPSATVFSSVLDGQGGRLLHAD